MIDEFVSRCVKRQIKFGYVKNEEDAMLEDNSMTHVPKKITMVTSFQRVPKIVDTYYREWKDITFTAAVQNELDQIDVELRKTSEKKEDMDTKDESSADLDGTEENGDEGEKKSGDDDDDDEDDYDEDENDDEDDDGDDEEEEDDEDDDDEEEEEEDDETAPVNVPAAAIDVSSDIDSSNDGDDDAEKKQSTTKTAREFFKSKN
jgi:hypothetical protein